MKYDVFLSHNSADAPLVEGLAARLQNEAGLSPFFDKWHLVKGDPWQEALERALDESATCAVFLGPSGLGVWENEEMRAALEERVSNRRFRLIPVLLPGADPEDRVVLPRFLRRVSWVDLRAGIDDAEGFRQLVAGIRGEPPGPGPNPLPDETQARFLQRVFRRLNQPMALLFAPTLLVAGAALILHSWRVTTRVDVTVSANRAFFRTGGNDSVPVLNTVGFHSLTVERFAQITFRPAKLEAADPAMYLPAEDRFPPSAWKRLTAPSQCTVTPASDRVISAVTLEGEDPDGVGGILDRLRVEAGSEVTLEARGTGGNLTVQLVGRQPRASVSFRGPFQMTTRAAAMAGIAETPHQPSSLTYRGLLAEDRPAIELTGQSSAITLLLTVSPEEMQKIFPQGSIPVIAMEFTRQGEIGNRVSSVVSTGQIGYPDFPSIPKAGFKSPDLIGLDELQGFRIEEMGIDGVNHGLRLRLSGQAGHITTGSREYVTDHRLTGFDVLWQNPVMLAVVGIVAWLLPTVFAGYRLMRGRSRQP